MFGENCPILKYHKQAISILYPEGKLTDSPKSDNLAEGINDPIIQKPKSDDSLHENLFNSPKLEIDNVNFVPQEENY